MTRKNVNKQEIINTACELIRLQGYHNTSMAQIASACNLSKASIYYHVESKKEIIEIAIVQLVDYFKKHCFCYVYDTTLDANQRLDKVLVAIDTYFNDTKGGCLVGNLTLELSDANTEFHSLFEDYFNSWIRALARIFAEKYSIKRSLEIAEDIICQLQGAIMLQRVYQRKDMLNRTFERARVLLTNVDVDT